MILAGHSFHVHQLENDELGPYVGGASDLLAATSIACTVYTFLQRGNPRSDLVVVVVDDLGEGVAFVGLNPMQPGLPE